MEELDPHGQVLTVTERGYGKRTPVEDYRLQGRGGLGIINLKVSPKTGEVVGVRYVTPDEGLMLITQEGMIIRLNVSGVREVGRSAQGVKLMNLDAEDCIVAVAKLAEKDEETEIELAKADGGTGAGRAGARGGRRARRADDGRRLSASSTTSDFEDEDDDDDEDDETVPTTIGSSPRRVRSRPRPFCPVHAR